MRPWYAHYPADYERKTAHLTMLEDGAYRRLLDRYYITAKPLDKCAENLQRICRAFSAEERAAIVKVLEEFFDLKDDGYHNSRADEEISTAKRISKTNALSGRRGGEAARGKSGRKPNGEEIADEIANAEADEIADELQDELRKNTQSQSHTHIRNNITEKALKPKAKRTVSLPEGVPEQGSVVEAVKFWKESGRRDIDGDKQAKQFRDYHLSRGSRMADWPAAWRTWYRNAIDYNKPAVNGARYGPQQPAYFDRDDELRERVKAFKDRKFWLSTDGAPPDNPECTVPKQILREFGYA